MSSWVRASRNGSRQSVDRADTVSTCPRTQRRSTLSPKELCSVPEAGITTVYDMLKRSARLFPDTKGLGYRDLIKVHNVDKEITKNVDGKEVKETKNWKYFEMTASPPQPFCHLSFSDRQDPFWILTGLQVLDLFSILRQMPSSRLCIADTRSQQEHYVQHLRLHISSMAAHGQRLCFPIHHLLHLLRLSG